jgi:hypothetical protein
VRNQYSWPQDKVIQISQFATYNTSDATTGNAVLGANASMTPVVIQTFDSSSLNGTIASDQSGTLTIAQSFDGTNWDGPSTPIAVVGGTPQSFTIPIIGPFVQASYTNGATLQGYMRLFIRASGKRG